MKKSLIYFVKKKQQKNKKQKQISQGQAWTDLNFQIKGWHWNVRFQCDHDMTIKAF